MKKNILKFLCILILSVITVFCFSSCALNDLVSPNDGVLTYQLSADRDYYIVTGLYDFFNMKLASEIIIPEEFNGLPVKSILSIAFFGCPNLSSVIIPDSVTIIGNAVFFECRELTNVVIPDSVTWIGDRAFAGCHNLASIVIPDSVTSIEWSALTGCNNLTIYCESTDKPSGWDSNWNSSERPIVWDYKNNNIADDGKNYGFFVVKDDFSYTIKNGKATLISSVSDKADLIIPSVIKHNGNDYSVTAIGDSAFKGCKRLTSVVISKNVTEIGEEAFMDCRSLASIKFEDTDSWFIDNTPIDVTDESENAANLSFEYDSWQKK